MNRIKAAAVRHLPGVIPAYLIAKNLTFRLSSGLPTHGGILRAGLAPADAVGYVRSIFVKVDELVRRHGGWSGKRVLEIGPGDSLGCGVLALAAGAARYTAVDRFRVRFDPQAEREVYRRLAADLASKERARVTAVLDLERGEAHDRKRWLYQNDLPIEQAPAVLGAGCWDVIFSNAVLEHVADLHGTLAACAALIAPEGVMLHDVDLRSHQTYERHALQFLEFGPALWRVMSSHSGEPNRHRLPTYRRWLAELGFRDVDVTITQRFDRELIERVRSRLARPFSELATAELEPAVFLVTARAPHSAASR